MDSQTDQLNLSEWGLPKGVLNYYQKRGITQMFPWQMECLSIGSVLEGENLIYTAPTSAGKTLVAEILVAQTVFEKKKKALIILPFVSVVREKMFYFQEMFSESGIRVEGFMGGHTPTASFQQVQIGVCTIEKANSLINKMLEEKSLSQLGIVVVDELHLLGDQYRGYLLELLLTKLKYMSLINNEIQLQVVGMSATLPNLNVLARWLQAKLYYTEFRPVPLSEHLKCGVNIMNKNLQQVRQLVVTCPDGDDSENVGQLCIETISNGHAILIFCPTKVWCENLAVKLALYFRKLGCSKEASVDGSLGWTLRQQLNLSKLSAVVDHLKISPVGLDKDLAKTVPYGVAFHHAGLTLDERDIIEGSFRNGSLRVLCATSTLSSGVNLPARRVIIRSPMSFGGIMDIMTYRQMTGRAGRMGVDTEGESILICKPSEMKICQQLMTSQLKPIESCLGSGRLSASLKRAILEVVASGIVSSREQVAQYAASTFLASTCSKSDLEDPLTSCLQFLEDNELIRLVNEKYVPTPLGLACLASSLPPDEGLALFRELDRARRCFVLDSDLHIIYQITPYSVSEQWGKIDWLRVLNMLEELSPSMRRVADLVGVEDSFLVKVVKSSINTSNLEHRSKLSIHRRFYTALALQELVNEVPLPEVAIKFDCNKGMLQSLQQSAATYAGMVGEFAKRLRWSTIELIVSQFQERLQFGVQRELCELMRLPSLNGVRARALFNAGMSSLREVANSSPDQLEDALLTTTPFESRERGAGEAAYEAQQRTRLLNVWITGRAGLTLRQAAEMLIKEAREILQLEVGVDVMWGNGESAGNSTSPFNRTRNSTVNVSCNLDLKRSVSYNAGEKINSETLVPNTEFQIVNNIKVEAERDVILPIENKDKESLEINRHVEEVVNIKATCTQNENEDKCQQQQLNLTNNANKNLVMSNGQKTSDSSMVDCFEGTFNIPDQAFNKITSHVAGKSVLNEDCESRTKSEESFSHCDKTPVELNEPENILHPTFKEMEKSNLKEKNCGEIPVDYFHGTLNMEELINVDHEAKKDLRTPVPVFKSRYSTDLFENTPKPFSTPIGTMKSSSSIDSPDLFSQSLTFDTQLQQACDSEDAFPCFAEDIPASPPKSDDLGYLSDSSPKIIAEISAVDKVSNLMETVGESFFAQGCIPSSRVKRKASPDMILGSDDSMSEETKRVKKSKFSKSVHFRNKVRRQESQFPHNLQDSDDEIASTPNEEMQSKAAVRRGNSTRRKLLNLTTRSKSADSLSKTEIVDISTDSMSQPSVSKITTSVRQNFVAELEMVQSINWDTLNIVDVCGNRDVFESFRKEFKQQNVVGLAFGFRRREIDKNSCIGAKFKRNVETLSEPVVREKFMHNDVELDGVAFYWHQNYVFYMSCASNDIANGEMLEVLKDLSSKTIRIFDMREQIRLASFCTETSFNGCFEDVKVASWLLSTTGDEDSLRNMTAECFESGLGLIEPLGSIPVGSSVAAFADSNVAAKIRACFEAALVFHISHKQKEKLLETGLLELYRDLEMPTIKVLVEMELEGMTFDEHKLKNFKKELEDHVQELEKRAHILAGRKFALSSVAAVAKVLYTELRLNKNCSNLKKKPNTSKESLEELEIQTKHPLPRIILMWRKLQAILNKTICHLLQLLPTTRIHGSCQTLTVTGRISMKEPNMQNIPKNFQILMENDKIVHIKLRDIFVAPKGFVLVSADYCQIELRILAHLSADSSLMSNIINSPDVFNSIASTIYGIPEDMVNVDQRQQAKQTCYGIIYGIGSRSLAHQLKIEEAAAQELMSDFKTKYKGIGEFLLATIRNCQTQGYVESLRGRRRYLPAINSDNPAARSEAERQAVNTRIQGSAADLVKKAMIDIRNQSENSKLNMKLILHLHDEVIYQVPENFVMEAAKLIKNCMEKAWSLKIPMTVKLKAGSSWGQLESLST